MKIIAADHVIPISSQPFREGGVVITGTKIEFVGMLGEIEDRYPDREIEHFGKAVILPGLVNAHSHLELTGLRGALDSVEHDFRKWLLRLNELRSARTAEQLEQDAYDGAVEAASAGVTCLGDIGRFGRAGLSALKRSGHRGIIFQETEFSPDNRTADADLSELLRKFEALRTDQTDLVSIGLSPHSTYTVGSRLLEALAQVSILEKIQLAIHVAESMEEVELLTKGTGFFSEIFDKFDLDWSSPGCSPVHYLERIGILSSRPLLVHCVSVYDDDISRISDHGAKIAHCPRSNAKFGHGYAPFERFLDRGIAVGLGSDSVASNNECDILGEARFAAFAARNAPDRIGFVSSSEVLTAATIGGARALGLDHLIGTLEVGKEADITVIGLDHPAQQPITDIEATLVFSSSGRDVKRTMVAGRTIYP